MSKLSCLVLAAALAAPSAPSAALADRAMPGDLAVARAFADAISLTSRTSTPPKRLELARSPVDARTAARIRHYLLDANMLPWTIFVSGHSADGMGKGSDGMVLGHVVVPRATSR